MADKFLSIFNVGGTNYLLKDNAATQKLATLLGTNAVKALGEAAWKAVATEVTGGGEALPTAEAVKSYVTSQVGQIHSFDVVIDPAGTANGPSVTASADTMYKIYMVADGKASAGSYIEWITIRSGSEGAYTYAWEKIGSTQTDLTGYVSKETTIAGLQLNNNISTEALQSALGLKAFAYAAKGTATVDSKTVSGVKATGTSTGSITGAMDYTATEIGSTGKVTATGSITGSAISGGSIAVTLKDAEAATAATVTA